jgi:hypothetical protein
MHLLLLAASALAAESPRTVHETRSYTDPKLHMTVVGGEVELPAGADWEVVQPPPNAALSSVYFVPPAELRAEKRGKVMELAERERKIEIGRWRTQQWYPSILAFARQHQGVGPPSFEALWENRKDQPYLRESLNRSPWPEDRGSDVKGPFFFLVPQVPVLGPTQGPMRREEARPLVLDLRPYVADGKHWVLYSDGRCERRDIDPQLVAKYGLAITAVHPKEPSTKTPTPETFRHRVFALRRADVGAPVEVDLRDDVADERIALSWDLRNAAPGPRDLLGQWATARFMSWVPMLLQPDSTVLRLWTVRLGDLYGAKPPSGLSLFGQSWRGDRTTNVFDILGGRAAVRETLQLQAIGPPAGTASETQSIPVETLPGVQVKSHPFSAMLGGKEGGRLPLADVVPHDHCFVYFRKPATLIEFLQGGSDFLARTGGLATRSAVDDGLESKYLARLGLGGKWAREFLRHGFVSEVGVILPDLFLLDGTEVTVLMRVSHMGLALAMLRVPGISGLEAGAPLPVRLHDGGTAYWAARGDLLMVSTHPQELDRVLRLSKEGGEDSLGRSAEFRYMLTQLPLRDSTVGYAYLSDPFIRKLVSPATKIGQLRRLHAHADLQAITAGALLYKADGQTGTPTLARLTELGYVPASLSNTDYTLGADLAAESGKYGTLARPASLLLHPVSRVSSSEAAAYKRYLAEYEQFWRQFFDPIAVRWDDTGSGSFQISTFVLPLVDSQLYNQVRAVVATKEQGRPLDVPSLTPRPLLMLSLNLRQESWVHVARTFSDLFGAYSGLDPELLDYLGPSVHLAIADSDPIIALGSGNVLGAFGGRLATMRSGWLFLAPFALSVLTRPSTLVVELSDPQKVLTILRRAGYAAADPGRRRETNMSLSKIAGRDAWVYSIDVLGVAGLSFGLEVQGNSLIIRNLPWTQRAAIGSVVRAAMNGALLQASPNAAEQQLPALYASAVAQERAAAVQGMAYLYPLLLSVSGTPEEAAATHARLFGFEPVHPASDQWLWKGGVLASALFGTPRRPQQPEYQGGSRDFGLLPSDVDSFSVNMQFEDAGLRASLRWSLRQR